MSDHRRAWAVALLAGVTYLIIGRVFASNVLAVRWAAWAVSAVVYGAHVAFEHFTLRNTPRHGARHVALGVAIGSFGIAVAALVHTMAVGSPLGLRWFIALFVFPLVIGVPAYIVALGCGLLLDRIARH